VAQLRFTAYHDWHPFAVSHLEFRMGIDIDDLDIGTQFLAHRSERSQEVLTQMTPGSAVDRQARPLPICHRHP